MCGRSIGSGVDGAHPHFRLHRNLELQPPLVHRDFTFRGPEESSQLEALIDRHGSGTHDAGLIAGELTASAQVPLYVRQRVIDEAGRASLADAELPAISGVAPRTKIVSLRVIDENGRGRVSDVLAALSWVHQVNNFSRVIRVHGVKSASHTPTISNVSPAVPARSASR